MTIRYDKLINKLNESNYTSYKMKQTKLMSQATYTALMNGTAGLSADVLDRLCKEFKCQPEDLMEYTPYDIVRRTHTQLMVNHQQLTDAVNDINHEEQFFSLSARSSLRNFLENIKEAFAKGIPVGFYTYMTPEATIPGEQYFKPTLLVESPEDLWEKWGNRFRDEKKQKFLKEIFNQTFSDCVTNNKEQ